MSSSSLTSSSNPAGYLAGAALMNPSAPGLMGQKSSLTKCACLFLKVTDWMKRAGVKQYHSGFLECPNEECRVKLG